MSDDLRADVAGAMRELGHEFVARDLDAEALAQLREHLHAMNELLTRAPRRVRELPDSLDGFKMAVPAEGRHERRQLFADSIVSGSTNPMGLGASLWREGDTAFMEVTLGRAFEGAPGRSHGGVVAALIDETMGLVLAVHDLLAFTGQLNITYLAPTPLHTPLVASARLDRRDGRKLHLVASVLAGETEVASASALFVAVDPERFLAHLRKAT
ncbi:MAG: PaaI family thioesterase [Acidobacteriota bacterium]|nr:PaaI family thioesterase [Acidobacteriota bacterium]MDE3043600.1 PaaI family thioesterase [Acidobacteriota bacterium]MDE3106970.1 PaaI family thioesterase [Acidobacteriota bacterium]MDE3223656.1 PaaI family thioesterase [Acidobacteriota bacterium]